MNGKHLGACAEAPIRIFCPDLSFPTASSLINPSPRPCSPHESQVLARAIKEHERRDGRREGFADTPGDVLAYKYFRDVS